LETPMTNKSISDKLGEPFPKSAIKTHPQNRTQYVEGHVYIHRLIDATDNTWDFKIVRQDFHPYGKTSSGNARLLITVIGELTIPGMGTRSGMGVQVVTAETGGEDMWKGALTDAIKTASKLFGVGLELYGPDYESGEISAPAPQPAARQQRAQAAPAPTAVRPAAQPAHGSTSQWDVTATKINEGQRRYLEGIASERLYTHDDMKRMITERYPVTSSKDLTTEMFEDFKKYLNGLPRQSPSPEAQANLDDFNRRNPAQPGRK
jgi:hypothetical protein